MIGFELYPPMDTETFEAIETLRDDIRRVEVSLRGEVGGLREDLRRYFDIVAESLRDDIRIIAEGVVALDAKVVRFLSPDRRA
jgi:hypothetical protein